MFELGKVEFDNLSDVQKASQGLLRVEANFDDPDASLSDVQHLLYNPHGRPTLTREEDLVVDPDAVPTQFRDLRNLLRSELGLPIVGYSWYRADGGSREIAAQMLADFAQRGEKAVALSPVHIGRGVLDLNRPRERAVGEKLFPMPELVAKDLMEVFDISTSVVFRLFETLAARQLKSVIQPHTMASGEPTKQEMAELKALAQEVESCLSEGSGAEFSNPEKLQALLAKWAIVYGNMNGRRGRADVDIVNALNVGTGDEDILEQIPDNGLSARIAENLSLAGVPNAFSKPFAHLPGYPGSDLAALAGKRGYQQACFDVPRHLLLRNPADVYQPLTFQPDLNRVKLVAEAVVRAIE